jgi:hypothetical protein
VIVDANGNPISGASLVSESGTDYNAITETPTPAQGGKGVPVPGCPCCRKRFGTIAQFLEHLTDDVLPAILDKLSADKT